VIIKKLLFLFAIVLCLLGCATTPVKDRVSKAYTHYTLGLLYDKEGNFHQAIEEFRKALDYDSTAPSIYLNLGIDYIYNSQYDKAIEQLKLASKYDPQDTRPYFLLALLYASQKNLEETIKQYKQILRIEPENFIALSGLSAIYAVQEKFVLVAPLYEKILTIKKNNPFLFYSLGLTYLRINKFNLALEKFKKAIDEPEQGAYADSLGWVYYKKALELSGQKAEEMLKESLVEINKALTLMGDEPTVREHLGDIYFQKGLLEKAKKEWKKSLRLDPENKRVKEKLKKVK